MASPKYQNDIFLFYGPRVFNLLTCLLKQHLAVCFKKWTILCIMWVSFKSHFTFGE